MRALDLRWSDIAILGVAAAFSPLDLIARNLTGIPHPERLLILVLATWLVAVGYAHLARSLGYSRGSAVFLSFLGVVVLVRGANLTNRFGPWGGWMLAIGLIVLVGFLVGRLESQVLPRIALAFMVVFVGSLPVVSLFGSLTQYGGDTVADDEGLDHPTLIKKPDIFLVVLDGYAGALSLERDFGISEPAWRSQLTQRGFDVPVSAWSAYSLTRASIPSILDMGYPVVEGDEPSIATQGHLDRIIAGDSNVRFLLSENGYNTTMVESGWSGSACGAAYDSCIRSSFLDEAVYQVLSESMLGPLVKAWRGHASTVGAQQTMAWLLDNGTAIANDGQPDFVFAHLLAPHPPFFMDSSCDISYSPENSGVTFGRNGVDTALRKEGYLAQAACIDAFMSSLADRLPPETLIVFVADHGTDSRTQLAQHASMWDQTEVAERFNILLAVRSGEHCDVGDPVMAPNLFRRLLSCLGEEDIDDLVPRMFIYPAARFDVVGVPVIEVESATVVQLLDS